MNNYQTEIQKNDGEEHSFVVDLKQSGALSFLDKIIIFLKNL